MNLNMLYAKNTGRPCLNQDCIFTKAENIGLDLLETKRLKGEIHNGTGTISTTRNEIIVIPDDFESEQISNVVINKALEGRSKNIFINLCDEDIEQGVEYLDFDSEIISNVIVNEAKLEDSGSNNLFVNLCDKGVDSSVEYLKLKTIKHDYFVSANGDVTIVEETDSKILPSEKQAECFEAIFFPEVYEGVAIETPFFDIDSYKERLTRSTDDVKHVEYYQQTDTHCDNNTLNVNVMSSKSTQPIVGCEDGHNSYIPQSEPVIINLDTDNELDDFSNSYHENVCQNSAESNTHSGEQAKTKGDSFFYCTPTINEAGKIKMGSSCEKEEVDGKYQCPICPHLKVFDTTMALNNHMQFQHLVFFNC